MLRAVYGPFREAVIGPTLMSGESAAGRDAVILPIPPKAASPKKTGKIIIVDPANPC
jgi:hypothetical protein